MLINFKIVFKTIGAIIFIVGGFMVLPLIISLIYGSDDLSAFVSSCLICLGIGSALFSLNPKSKNIRKREGYLIVALSWIAICLLGALPYLFQIEDLGIINGIFESSSGFTTTGASIFNDVESLPEGILFWRSLTQWIGGMGIIVFTIAIFPLLGVGGVELFVAESPGPTSDKIHPRIKSVAIRLWLIYLGLTLLLCSILFLFSGMNFFDSINHALTTLSTGGFSTKNSSIAFFGPECQYPIMLFMVIGGVNFTILYYLLKRKFKRAFQSEEFKYYLLFLFLVITAFTLILYYSKDIGLEKSFRDSAFQIISLVTTTGYITTDYTAWNNTLTLVCFLLLFIGGSAGSTAGGIKIVRHLVLLKNSILEYVRLLHPNAYIRLKIDHTVVNGRIITHILVFLLSYTLLFIIGSLIMMTLLENDPNPFLTSIGSVATSLANVGPAIGSVGPIDTFGHLPGAGKLLLTFLMIVGRLELFTVLILFTPYFWRTK
jgi:trk system potassium uptake protein TrkH